jgi:hypothetical protein
MLYKYIDIIRISLLVKFALLLRLMLPVYLYQKTHLTKIHFHPVTGVGQEHRRSTPSHDYNCGRGCASQCESTRDELNPGGRPLQRTHP